MKEMFRIALSIALCAVMICNAAPLAVDKKNVASLGTTEIANSFGKIHVSVKIETHEVDIGRPSDPWPERRVSSCTHSRFPCSLVEGNDLQARFRRHPRSPQCSNISGYLSARSGQIVSAFC